MFESKGNITVLTREGVQIVQINDRQLLEQSVIDSITQNVSQLAYTEASPKLIIDLKAVEWMSSSGLGMLIAVDRVFKVRSGRAIVVGVRPEVRDVFKVSRVDQFMEIKLNVEEAMKSFRADGKPT